MFRPSRSKRQTHEGVGFTKDIERSNEFWPRLRSTTDVLLKHPAALRFFERVELQRKILLVRRDSGVTMTIIRVRNARVQLRSVDYVINFGAL